MGYKLLITPYQDKIISALYDGKRLVQVSVDEQKPSEICVGGIYVGKVKNIVANINAAFVELRPGLMAYLALEQAVAPITANTHADGKIHAGDELVVQVEREPIKSKLASVTTGINLTGKYAVLIHGKSGIGISAKIEDTATRVRLKDFVSKYVENACRHSDTLNSPGSTNGSDEQNSNPKNNKVQNKKKKNNSTVTQCGKSWLGRSNMYEYSCCTCRKHSE